MVVEMGDMLAVYGRYGEAQKCFWESAKSFPTIRRSRNG